MSGSGMAGATLEITSEFLSTDVFPSHQKYSSKISYKYYKEF